MKFVDCFIFYNELDMLEYRLNTLGDHVDYFVIVEASRTHSGKPKKLWYRDHAERFAKYASKIVHVIDNGLEDLGERPLDTDVTSLTEFKRKVWLNENHQRNAISQGINGLISHNLIGPEDYLIITDVDEIIHPRVIEALRQQPVGSGSSAGSGTGPQLAAATLEMDFYYYHLMCRNAKNWDMGKIMTLQYYQDTLQSLPQVARDRRFPLMIKNSGWHLSYFGDSEFIRNKLQNFAHQEWNNDAYTSDEAINDKIKRCADLFGRANDVWINVPLTDNPNLPPNYQSYPFLTGALSS